MAAVKRRLGLRIKVISLIVLIVVVVVGAAAYLSVQLSEELLEEEMRENAITLARELAAGIRGRGELEEPSILEREIGEVMEVHPLISQIEIFVLRPSGPELVALRSKTGVPPTPLQSIPSEVMASLVWEGGHRLWEVGVPIRIGQETVGALKLKFSLQKADELAGEIHLHFALIMGVAVVLIVALLGAFFDRVVDRPIRELIGTMERARTGDLSARVKPKWRDEIGDLGKSLNHMLSRIEEGYRQNVELLEQINRFNEDLKAKVRRATEQLEKRNEDLRRANELLFDTQRLLTRSERLAMVGEMAATIAHEIGTPLSSISGHVQLLLQQSSLDNSIAPRLKIVEGQIARTVDILQGLLDLARQPDPAMRLLDVNHLLKEILDLTLPALGLKRVVVQEAYDHNLPAILGDAHQLQQVFLNIIANALDAMPGGGELAVETTSAGEGQPRKAARWVRVQIADTGSGVAPEDLEKIFEPFFTTKEKGRGTGLGLAICHRIVKAHGGTIEVHSQAGKGTTFSITLPAKGPTIDISAS